MVEERKEWYVVNTYAGHENRVKENLERRVETMGLQDALFRIVVAEETEIGAALSSAPLPESQKDGPNGSVFFYAAGYASGFVFSRSFL